MTTLSNVVAYVTHRITNRIGDEFSEQMQQTLYECQLPMQDYIYMFILFDELYWTNIQYVFAKVFGGGSFTYLIGTLLCLVQKVQYDEFELKHICKCMGLTLQSYMDFEYEILTILGFHIKILDVEKLFSNLLKQSNVFGIRKRPRITQRTN
jgi:hypothetical protein